MVTGSGMRQGNLDFGDTPDATADAAGPTPTPTPEARSDTPDPYALPAASDLPTAVTSGTAGFGGMGWNSVRDWRAAEPDPGDHAMWTELHVAMECEAEIDQRVDLPCGTTEPYSTPVIPPDRMLDFQREWCHRPLLRMCIRRAGEMGPRTLRTIQNTHGAVGDVPVRRMATRLRTFRGPACRHPGRVRLDRSHGTPAAVATGAGRGIMIDSAAKHGPIPPPLYITLAAAIETATSA